VCHNVAFYLYKLALPLTLSPQYPLPDAADVRADHGPFLAGIVVTALLVLLFAWAVRRGRRAVVAGLAGFFLLIGPAIGMVNFMGAIAADRFLYLPMLMMLAALTPATAAWADGRRGRTYLLIGVAAVLVVALGVKTYRQQSVWRDSFTYWDAVAAYAPDEPVVFFGRGSAFHERYVQGDPTGQQARTDLGQAEAMFTETLRRDPRHWSAYVRLAMVLLDQERPAEALDLVGKSFDAPYPQPEGRFVAGLALSRLGRYEAAIPFYEKYLARLPSRPDGLINLANALCHVGRWTEALPYYERLTRLDPTSGEGFYGLGRARMETGGAAAAIAPLQAARDRMPYDARTRFVLAACLAAAQRDDEALAELAAAIRLQPDLAVRAERQPQFQRLRETPKWERIQALDDSSRRTTPSADSSND
ncbi:MAG: tetratricopeptide repeat protein, partial [Phycisphaerae bacterium]